MPSLPYFLEGQFRQCAQIQARADSVVVLTRKELMPNENLFLEYEHPESRRWAVLEDDGTSAWFYLSGADSRKPIGDAWIYNRIAAPPVETIESYRGGPPPAAKGFVSEDALCEDPATHEWTFVWSRNGESVAVAKDGEAVAFIVGGQKRGYSRNLIKDGPWGHAWSEELFRSEFDETQ